ncbi:energy transducer TonB [Endozoicomonas euniceicola]|uniref:Energy transducer TonB n=1 Tax=Endozoicomonas euniceicola TaxID=1234143 RepID=A0ABY6GP62_9GAMM|nr:energy transducer TonB [Endozoicomonas euniceicola]UYM14475.1 energy transducer TonB [Endozoicomonas euniceicola]
MIQRWFANSLAALLMLTLLLYLSELQTTGSPPEETLLIRKVNTVVVPPPPPPPPSQQQLQQNTAVNLQVSQAEVPVKLKVTTLDVPLPELTAPVISSQTSIEGALEFDVEAVVAAITTFSLDELDEMPRLLTPITVRLPAALRQKGVRQAQVRLHIIIHENGRVELVNIEQMEYPELGASAKRIVKQARFSTPRRQGSKVKAEFIWPLKVSS